MTDRLIVVACFLLIFGFSTVDSAVSPMVTEIHAFFGVLPSRVLLLISSCTAGIVVGVFVGPVLTASFAVRRLLAGGTLGLAVSLSLFLLTSDFLVAILCRLLFGLSSGVIAACMWWITYYGVGKESYPAMVAVLMAARPLATAIGVPLAGLVAAKTAWQTPLWGFLVVIAVAGALLSGFLSRKDEGAKVPFGIRKIAGDYAGALGIPFAVAYYVGLAVNRMCYFGFYAICGIWFKEHFGLTLARISTALLIIGLGEAVINFIVPRLLSVIGHRRLFLSSLAASLVVFPLFMYGKAPLGWTIVLITIFMILDRIYCTAVVITLPEMFPQDVNRTVFGTLNTLAAWIGLTAISTLASRLLDLSGLPLVQHVLTICLLIGSALIYHVQARTVLRRNAGSSPKQ